MVKTIDKFEQDGFIFNIVFADYTSRSDHKTRIYVDGQDAPALAQPKSYVDNPENNKLWRAFNKAEIDAMRVVLDAGMDILDSKIHTMPEKIKFSRKAGCSCGCSAGFVADQPLRMGTNYNRVDSIRISKIAKSERTFTMADFDVASV